MQRKCIYVLHGSIIDPGNFYNKLGVYAVSKHSKRNLVGIAVHGEW